MAENLEVRDNPGEARFELAAGSALAIAAYRLDGGVISFTHTEVPPELAGRGIGTALVRGALAEARARGLVVRPRCPFVVAYMRRHKETQDLLHPADRAAFGTEAAP